MFIDERRLVLNTDNRILKNLSKALLSWYEFNYDSKALFVSGGFPECEVLFEVLDEKCNDVAQLHYTQMDKASHIYDYIVLAGVLEKMQNPSMFLDRLRSILSNEGKLIIATDNRLALKYFCGEKDPFTGNIFDGIVDYSDLTFDGLSGLTGRSYSQNEIVGFLNDAQISKYKFYSVWPSVERPEMIIAEGYIPNEDLSVRIHPQYKTPDSVFMKERDIYNSLARNNMLHQMANGYLIECSVGADLLDVNQVSVQGDRAPEEAMATIVADEYVSKRPLFKEGKDKIVSIKRETDYLKSQGIPIVSMEISQDSVMMPFVEGELATEYFRRLIRFDKQLLIKELEKFRDYIYSSSKHIPYDQINWLEFESGWEKRKFDDPNMFKWEQLANGSEYERECIGPILEKGYFDMVSLNCFHTTEGFMFFDQEFYVERFPANAILYRTIELIYLNNWDLEGYLSKENLLKYFNLDVHQLTWEAFNRNILGNMLNKKSLASYHKMNRVDDKSILVNRQRMNYGSDIYKAVFDDIFADVADKDIYLFGSGRYASRFIDEFKYIYKIKGVIDNNPDKWGTQINGITISSPDTLGEIEEPFKVFVCIRDYDNVLKQLKEMKIMNVSVYNPNHAYRRQLKDDGLLNVNNNVAQTKHNKSSKRYHIGYIAGVFDLFHIGHLNLLRNAKDMCDYLIVGVVSDAQVIESKKTSPYIPFDERIEIVRACKYVDEAVAIPQTKCSTEAAYGMYHFDVQFSGSDYENDPLWIANREFLRKQGSDIVFFPYTQSTSSTKLKEKIEN